jgi:hypothetical protein
MEGAWKAGEKKWFGMNYTNNFAKALAYQPYILNTEWQSYYHKPIRWEGVFECPWIQILIRDTEDALTYIQQGKQAESM